LICINGLPGILRNISIPVLFVQDTSIIINSTIIIYVQTNIKEEFKHLNEWFILNVLLLNFDKTNFIHLKRRIPVA
jgi:hypothetical protein